MPHAFHIPAQMGELIEESMLTLDDLARACCRAPAWVSERVDAGVIAPAQPGTGLTTWRFSSTTVVRARRIAQLETTFGADPYLAALTADLMEEVATLRRRLHQIEEHGGAL